jgi:hypothetical protein
MLPVRVLLLYAAALPTHYAYAFLTPSSSIRQHAVSDL